MLDSTVYTPGADESGARGAAMFAASAVGHAPVPLQAALQQVDPIADQRSYYGQYLANFEGLLADMGPVFARLNRPLP